MIALLPRYCLSEKLNKHLKNLDTKAESDNKNVKAEIVQAYLDVATNVTMYCRSIVSRSGMLNIRTVLQYYKNKEFRNLFEKLNIFFI